MQLFSPLCCIHCQNENFPPEEQKQDENRAPESSPKPIQPISWLRQKNYMLPSSMRTWQAYAVFSRQRDFPIQSRSCCALVESSAAAETCNSTVTSAQHPSASFAELTEQAEEKEKKRPIFKPLFKDYILTNSKPWQTGLSRPPPSHSSCPGNQEKVELGNKLKK